MECPHCGQQFILGDDICEHCQGDLTAIDPPQPRNDRLHDMPLKDPISQLNAPEPILLRTTDSLEKAVRLMKKLRYGSVLVVEDGRLCGIFTEHDLVRRFAGRETELSNVTLGEVMTPDPHSLHDEDSLAHALNRMAVGGYRHIPVLKQGKPHGFISIRGILSYLVSNVL